MPTPSATGTDSLGPPDLPDITLSPTPMNRSALSAVYLGWDRRHRCDVVVKVQRVTQDPVAMERFRREAAVMAQLRHPSIVSLYRFHEGDPAALVMEYVRGQTLAALLKADGWLPAVKVAAIVDSIAAALDSAHAVNIIHRDVKPANILLPKHGPARLSDFGVAHIDDDAPLTVMGDMLGTIEYASPEQVRGHETPDARSDVYSLAAVTYFALTGTPPFRAADESTQAQLSVMHRQVFAEPPPQRFHREAISPAVEAVVLRGLAKAPEDRFQTAGYFAAAFHAAAEAGTGTPEQNAMAAATRRNGAMSGVVAAAALLLVGAGVWWKIHPITPPGRPPLPVAQAPKVSPPAVVTIPDAPPKPKPTALPKPIGPAVTAKRPTVLPQPVHPAPSPRPITIPRSAAPVARVPDSSVRVTPRKLTRKPHRAPALRPAAPLLATVPAVVTRKPLVLTHKSHVHAPAPKLTPAPPRPLAAPEPVPVFAVPAPEASEPSPPHLRNP